MKKEKNLKDNSQKCHILTNNKKNRFENGQAVRHALASVSQDGNKLRINKQVYHILINKNEAIDVEMLRHKYDPYLDQYDFLVGDISSEHLRLKGFYKDLARAATDRKKKAIADYLMEYCNPGSAYFVLELISPIHHYNIRKRNNLSHNYNKKYHSSWHKNNFKKKRSRKAKSFVKKPITIQKNHNKKSEFVIRKRKDSKS